jgi:hypothetical protein
MKVDFERFKGTLPYASELFGIYQPLLGWKSKMTVDRMASGEESLFRTLTERALARLRADVKVEVAGGPRGGYTATPLELLDVVTTEVRMRVAQEIDSIIARVLASQLPADRTPTNEEWLARLARQALTAELQRSKRSIEAHLANSLRTLSGIPPDVVHYVEQAVGRIRSKHNNDVATTAIL